MCPEYGATIGFFPPDAENNAIPPSSQDATKTHIDMVEAYLKAQGNLRYPPPSEKLSTRMSLEIDLADIETECPQGRKRPQESYRLVGCQRDLYGNSLHVLYQKTDSVLQKM